jgi:hypothetical protein
MTRTVMAHAHTYTHGHSAIQADIRILGLYADMQILDV